MPSKFRWIFEDPTKDRIYKTLRFDVLNYHGELFPQRFYLLTRYTRRRKGEIELTDAELAPGSEGLKLFIAKLKFGFERDWGADNPWTITTGDDWIEFQLTEPQRYILNPWSEGLAIAVVTNEDEISLETIRLDNIQFNPGPVGLECNRVSLTVTTQDPFTHVYVNGIWDNQVPFDRWEFTKTLIRDVEYSYEVRRTVDGNTVRLRIPETGTFICHSLDSELFELTLVKQISGTDLTITQLKASIFTYEFSINGSTWQTEPYFTDVPDGDYTLYVRDSYNGVQLGCIGTFPFTANSERKREPFIFISKANAILFKREQNIDNVAIFKNDNNSFNALSKDVWYCNEAIFNNSDFTTIQFHTSYNNVIATLRSEEGGAVDLPITKMSNNTDRFEALDGLMDRWENGKSIIYFNSGNRYDENGAVTGSYSLNGALPDFAIVGETIRIQGYGAHTIEEIVYLDSIGKKCIVVSIEYDQTEVSEVKIESLYNILEYDIYHFEIDWSLFTPGYYDVTLSFEDSDFTDIFFVSENIHIETEHENTVAIRYYNDNNKDIFYRYGIEHFIRARLVSIRKHIADEININITDQSVDTVDSTLNEGDVYIFDELTREQLTKLAIALSCEFIFVNGIKYTKSEPLELEVVEGTNVQRLSATLLLDNANYENLTNIDDIPNGDSFVDIPDLLTDNTDFIKL